LAAILASSALTALVVSVPWLGTGKLPPTAVLLHVTQEFDSQAFKLPIAATPITVTDVPTAAQHAENPPALQSGNDPERQKTKSEAQRSPTALSPRHENGPTFAVAKDATPPTNNSIAESTHSALSPNTLADTIDGVNKPVDMAPQEKFGIKEYSAESITLVNGAKIKVTSKLPNGEVILSIDPVHGIVETDRRMIVMQASSKQ
jgi:hypothetical protein